MKSIHNSLRSVIFALLLLVMVGCSGGSNDQQGAVSGDSSVIIEMQENYEKLIAENEKLHAELEIVLTKLEIAELKIENLTKEMNEIPQKLQAAEQQIANFEKQLAATKGSANETAQEKPLPSDKTSSQTENPSAPTDPSQLLLGTWYLSYVEEYGQFSWTQHMVSNKDGTGTLYKTYYVSEAELPSTKDAYEHGIGLDNFDEADEFKWVLVGDVIKITVPSIGMTYDYPYSATEQTVLGGGGLYTRETPAELASYVPRSEFYIDREAKEAQRMSKLLGLWYFDVLTWEFNKDKTGIINIPEIGDQPATTREFTFELPYYGDNDPNPILIIDWGNGDTGIYSIKFEADGSMILKAPSDPDPLKFTRSFDASNCPISTAIIESGMSVISGSMFSKFFP